MTLTAPIDFLLDATKRFKININTYIDPHDILTIRRKSFSTGSYENAQYGRLPTKYSTKYVFYFTKDYRSANIRQNLYVNILKKSPTIWKQLYSNDKADGASRINGPLS